MRNYNKYTLLAILVFCLMFVFLDNELTNQFSRKAGVQIEGLQQNINILALEITMFLYAILVRYRIGNNLIWKLLLLSLSIVAISFLLAIGNGPGFTIVLYLRILLPVPTLFFINAAIERLGKKMIIKVFSLIVIFLVLHYFSEYRSVSTILGEETFITNASYILLLFLPMVLCINNKFFRYSIVIMIVLAVLFSNKRGGLIAMVLSLLMFLNFNNVNIQKRKRIPVFLFSLMIFLIGAYCAYVWFGQVNDSMLLDRFMTMEETGGSHRTFVYQETFNMILSSDFSSILFGHGWNSVLKNSPLNLSAHNDFLEVMYDFGIVVFIIYVSSLYYMFKQLFKMLKLKSVYSGQFACAIFIIIVLSNVSHIIIYSQLFFIEIIVLSCLVQFDKISRNENRCFNISCSL